MDWVAFGSIATAVGVFVAAAAIIYQGYIARRGARLHNIWRLMEYWDSDKMWLMRAQAVREIKKREPASDMTDVLNFFDHVGYLLKKKWIDDEAVWIMFFTWALPYWHSALYAIEDEWRTDPLLWREFEYLIGRLRVTENKMRSKREMPPYVGASDEEIRELFRGEIGLSPGGLRWRKWLP